MPTFGDGGGQISSGRAVVGNIQARCLPSICAKAQFRPSAQQAVQWTPASLTSLKGWYQGDLLSGADGASKTTWSDNSGSTNDATTGATGPTLRTGVLGGLNIAEFLGSNSAALNFPNGMFGAFTEGSVFYIARNFLDPPAVGGFTGAVIGQAGTSGSGDHHPFSDSNIYDGFLSTTRKTVGNPGDLTQWYIGSFRSKASDYRFAYNGTDFFTTATNSIGGQTGVSYIGYGGISYYDGQIAEIVVCNNFLTETDRQNVEGYLAWKWGLVDSLPASHPYKFTPPPAVTAHTLTAATGNFALAGTAAALAARMLAATGAFALTGTALTPAVTMPAAVGAFALTGAALTPRVTMPAGVGAFSLTGTALAPAVATSAATGAFALTGTALASATKMVAATGTFTLTGTAATLAVKMTAATGAFSLNGIAVTPRASMAAGIGAFTLTGTGATLRVGMSAGTGSFVLSGIAVSFRTARILLASTGAFSLSGRAAGFPISLNAIRGTFLLTGQNAGLTVFRPFVVDPTPAAIAITDEAAPSPVTLIPATGPVATDIISPASPGAITITQTTAPPSLEWN
jgi:hypothetical protein